MRVRAKKTGVDITRAFLRYRKKKSIIPIFFSELCLTHKLFLWVSDNECPVSITSNATLTN